MVMNKSEQQKVKDLESQVASLKRRFEIARLDRDIKARICEILVDRLGLTDDQYNEVRKQASNGG